MLTLPLQLREVLVVMLACVACVSPTRAQCQPEWLPNALPGLTSGRAFCSTMWDPDGEGPLPPRIVLGGDFRLDGSTQNFGVVVWDGSHWSSLNSGVNGSVYSLASMPNGDLVAGGEFTTMNGVPASRIARWNGTEWHPIGSGMDYAVWSLAFLHNGDLVAGGDFTTAGGSPIRRIAKWNGVQWSPLGNPELVFGDNRATAFLVLPNGDLLAGCYGDIFTKQILARWDGVAWSGMMTSSQMNSTGRSVLVMALTPDGDLLIGGQFRSIDGVAMNSIARLHGTTWSLLGNFPVSAIAVSSLLVLPNQDVVAGGFFNIGNPKGSGAARWNGVSWAPLSAGTNGEVDALQLLPNGDILAGGLFNKAGGLPAPGVAVWGCRCHADFIPDGFVTGDDYDAFVSAFVDGLASADFSADGFVTADDFDAFSQAFVDGC